MVIETTTRNLDVLLVDLFLINLPRVFFEDLGSVSFIEEERLHHGPNIRISPMFAQDIRWVTLPWDVGEVHHPRRNRLSNKVVRECIMSLLQPGVRDTTALHNGLVISEHEGLACHWNSKVAEHQPQVDDLLNSELGCHEIQEDEAYSLYYVPKKKDVWSRQKIEHDGDLDGFCRHAGPPTVFVWKHGDPDMSPASIPSEVELSALSVEDSEGEIELEDSRKASAIMPLNDPSICKVVLHVGGTYPSIRQCVQGKLKSANETDKPLKVVLAIGPKRGWTDEEISTFQSNGFEVASLGSPILKTETAVVSGIALARGVLLEHGQLIP